MSCQIDKDDATVIIDTLSKRLKDRGVSNEALSTSNLNALRVDEYPKFDTMTASRITFTVLRLTLKGLKWSYL